MRLALFSTGLRGAALRQSFRYEYLRGHALSNHARKTHTRDYRGGHIVAAAVTAATCNNIRRINRPPAAKPYSVVATGDSNNDDLPAVLAKVAAGTLPPSDATKILAPLLVSGGARAEDVGGYAKIDHDRRHRTGFPEVVFGEGKSAQQILEILRSMVRDRAASTTHDGADSPIVATRVSPEKWAAISEAGLLEGARYHADARILFVGGNPTILGEEVVGDGTETESRQHIIGKVAVLSAGTSDLCVAEEAAVLAELAGAEVSRFHDVGVAGIHRLLSAIPRVQQAGVAICVAGMDGAMPGVVAGLVKCPVVAVPTSVGYGAAMSGLAPLLTMLNACAPGVSVVNIDNGFGAAAFAVKLLNSGARKVR